MKVILPAKPPSDWPDQKDDIEIKDLTYNHYNDGTAGTQEVNIM